MPEIIARGPQGQIQSTSNSAPQQRSEGNQSTSAETPPTQGGTGAAPKPEQKSPDVQRLEALARRERQLRQQAQAKLQQQDRQSQSEQAYARLQAENQQFRQLYQRFLRDPVSILNEAGVPGDVITQSLMNSGSREAVSIRNLSLQNRQLQQQLADLQKKIEDQGNKAQESTKTQIKYDVKRTVMDENSPYEAIKAGGSEAVEAVELLIEQTLQEEGRLLTAKEAADQVEDYLIAEAQKLAGLKKVKEKLGATEQPGQGTTTGSSGLNTLSNRNIPAPQSRKTGEKDRIARAVAAFEAAKAARAQGG